MPGSRCRTDTCLLRSDTCDTPVSCPWQFLRSLVSALVGGLFGSRALATAGRGHAAVSRVHLGARRDRARIRRRSAVRPPGLRRHRRHAAYARSAFELLRSRSRTRRCASGRKGATTGSAITIQAIDGDITVHVDLRRLARLQEGASAAATSSPRSAIDDMKGWTTEQAVKKLKGPKGTIVNVSISGAATTA